MDRGKEWKNGNVDEYVIGEKCLCEGGSCYCSWIWRDLRVGREWDGLNGMRMLRNMTGLCDKVWNLQGMN
jgi:hypothetical protein